MKKIALAILALSILMSGTAIAQTLDGRAYTPGVDPNIDLFFANWQDSEPFITHGTLEERSIFTEGDPLNPPKKGAVLSFCNRFTHATLPAGKAIEPTNLKGEQEIIYILSGSGKMKGRKVKTDLYPGICVLIPANCKFTMESSGSDDLTMYLVSEPIPDGFKPNKDILVRDENAQPIVSTDVHWCHIEKGFFKTNDGLGTLENVITITHAPMTIGHPHSHVEGVEEIWAEVTGTSIAFLGKQIRKQPPGTAYMIPPDGNTPHCNINTGTSDIKLFYFARYRDHEVRK